MNDKSRIIELEDELELAEAEIAELECELENLSDCIDTFLAALYHAAPHYFDKYRWEL